MTEITLYDTLTRAKQPLRPLDPENVRMYVCGPTVYDRAHIGNARPAVVFDVLYRLLRHTYGADHVTYVRNITDVDDKINARARETGRDIRAITDETIRWFHDDMAALGNLPPTQEPRATEYIRQMVAMIERLIARGHAYPAEGHVLFAVGSYADYGTLARRSLDEMRAGARVEVAPYKRDPMDFVLWKPSGEGEPGWDSPWGRGRPGWHIECSAMARELLGESFDIHGGGIDLVFPHHENERAQSLCAHPEGHFASIWMHNGFLQVEGEKMSKSLGNFFTVRDLCESYHPLVIRKVLLSTHYRKPLSWSAQKAVEHRSELAQWANFLHHFPAGAAPTPQLVEILSDELNTAGALAHLRSLFDGHEYERLRADCEFLGLWGGESSGELSRVYVGFGSMSLEISAKIDNLLRRIDVARNTSHYQEADRLRLELLESGVAVNNTSGGSTFSLTPDFSRDRLMVIE